MSHRMSLDAFALPSLLTAVALLSQVQPSAAAPVTLDLRMHLTNVCELWAVTNCSPADDFVPFSLTYDPDTFVLHDLVYQWWFDLGSLDYQVPFAALPNPWGPDSTRFGSGTAVFSNNGPGYIEYRQLDLGIGAGFHADSCADGDACTWLTGFELHLFAEPTLPFAAPPTAADVEELFHRGSIVFSTQAYYYPDGGERVYVPGSRVYLGNVPEPAVDLLLLTAGVVAALRRRLSM